MAAALFVLVGRFWYVPALRAQSEKLRSPESLYLLPLEVAPRLSFFTSDLILDEPKEFTRYRTAGFSGEAALLDWLSLWAGMPWSKIYVMDLNTRSHYDNMPVGIRMAGWTGSFLTAAGLTVYLPTGRDDSGIGSKSVGSLEPYFAAAWKPGKFFLSFTVRYNAQTNKRFTETDTVQFSRMWLVEAVAGLVFRHVDILAELRRKALYDPEIRRVHTYVVSPGVNIKLTDSLTVGIGIPYTLSKEREFDAGVVAKATYYY